MKNYQKKALRISFYMLALFASLTVLEAGVKFTQNYKYIGFEKKDQTKWVNIAEGAEGQLSACQRDLEQAKADKDTAIKANNEDLFQPITIK